MTVHIYSRGMVHCSVCVPKETPIADIEREVNEYNPTGIEPQWKLSTAATFITGQTNPCPCEQYPLERLHYLMVC
jgi:hypothetical protein